MLYLHTNNSFMERQNKRIDVIPKINGVPFSELILKDNSFIENNPRMTFYYSLLEKDPYVGIVEVVYGIRHLSKINKNVMQKLIVIPEKKSVPIIRNCFYRWGGMAQGFFSYGYDRKGYSCSIASFDYLESFDFMDEPFPIERVPSSQKFISAAAMTELDPSLKWCAYDPDCYIDAIDYIRLYRKHPQCCEMLMKAKLRRFLNDKAILMLEDNKRFAFWVAKNAKAIRDEYMAPATAFNAWKKNPCGDPADYSKSLKYRMECGRAVAFDNRKVYDKALKYTTQERLAEYIRDNHINNRSYGDYLIAADWLRLDFADTKVLFPRNFHEVHDSYTEQYGAYCHAQELAAQRERERKNREEIASRAERMKQVADRFAFLGSYKAEGFCVIVATTKDELIDEGFALSHCVGRMDYDKRQAEGRSVICFIRHDNDRHTPFVTAEVKITDQQLKVVQCYGDHDRVVPEVADFTAGWMTSANKAYSEKRRKMA